MNCYRVAFICGMFTTESFEYFMSENLCKYLFSSEDVAFRMTQKMKCPLQSNHQLLNTLQVKIDQIPSDWM